MAYAAPIKDPQNPDVPDYDPETPDLHRVLDDALHAHSIGLRVCLPASVTAVSGVQQVDVQPSLQARYVTQAVPSDLPIIKNVPVCMPMGQNYSIKLPIAVGDLGMLVFCDRSLDAWSQSDGARPVDPADTRAHDLTDPVFMPGLVPFGKQLADTTQDLVLRNGDTTLRLLPNGKILAGSTATGGNELLDLLGQSIATQLDLINVLSSQTLTLTLLGPQPFVASTVAALKAVADSAKAIKDKLAGIRG